MVVRSSCWLAIVLASACGGGTPAAPTVTPSWPQTLTIRLTETVTGAPVGSVAHVATGLPSTGTITRADYLERVTAVETMTPVVDLIPLRPPFDLTFWRQLARNSTEGALRPLVRQAGPVRIALKTVDEAGAPVPAEALDMTHAALEHAAAELFEQPWIRSVERGIDRQGQAGWVTILWDPDTAKNQCGAAELGGTRIWLNYLKGSGCQCGGRLRERTVYHELGHAVGLSHTSGYGGVMHIPALGCSIAWSDLERHHVAVLYARPRGNVDPDTDAGLQATRDARAAPPVIVID